ncbi:MAG: RDD family protein [Luteolibacter sp.]|uniref:RDD family protein n=1 Tax=Luteolibacter sp. TaxID=1962973 RepID=UPI0032638DA3
MRYLNYRPANNFKRAIAYMIDVIPIQFGLYFISQAFFGVSPIADFFARPDAVAASLKAKLLIDAGTLGIWILYCIVGELSPWRGTFGKKMMDISVRSATGRRLTFGQVLGRNTAKVLSAIPLYIGFLAAFFVYGNRAWHDSLSGTAVTDRK